MKAEVITIKRIQNKILLLVISSILISTSVVVAVAFFSYNRYVENSTNQIMQLMCSETKQEIDEQLLNIEQSVHTIYHFAIEQIKDPQDVFTNEKWRSSHLTIMRELMRTLAKYTDGAVTVYYRLNPEIQGKHQGVWLVEDETGEFVEKEMTDIIKYTEDDVEHVGWYYVPVKNGGPTWMNPYHNKNMDIEMMSYVIPVIYDDLVIGVVGMDIATEILYESTKSVTIYETGYAFLMDNEGGFVYHPEMGDSILSEEFNEGHRYLYEKSLLSVKNQSIENYYWANADKRLTTQELCNGMLFTVCVTEDAIKQPRLEMFSRTGTVIILMISLFIYITINITRMIVKLIYGDALTGAGNGTAYREKIDVVNRKILEARNVNFVVAVLDINNLKKANDNYGHEYGDALIKDAASILKKIWGQKNVFRIGGDEFAVIMLDTDAEKMQQEAARFEAEIELCKLQRPERELHLQVAIGIAQYEPNVDSEYLDVFRKADNAMYVDKKLKKSKMA